VIYINIPTTKQYSRWAVQLYWKQRGWFLNRSMQNYPKKTRFTRTTQSKPSEKNNTQSVFEQICITEKKICNS